MFLTPTQTWSMEPVKFEIFIVQTLVKNDWVDYRMFPGRKLWEDSDWSKGNSNPQFRALKHTVWASGTFETAGIWGVFGTKAAA